MGYGLSPNNNELDSFHFGAFSFPVLLEACGYLFPCIHDGGSWYCAFGTDERMPTGDTYPRLLSNDGFKVTAEEARIMARVARNFVAIQRTLPDYGGKENWPIKMRTDFTDKFEQFAEWAEKSEGFAVW